MDLWDSHFGHQLGQRTRTDKLTIERHKERHDGHDPLICEDAAMEALDYLD